MLRPGAEDELHYEPDPRARARVVRLRAAHRSRPGARRDHARDRRVGPPLRRDRPACSPRSSAGALRRRSRTRGSTTRRTSGPRRRACCSRWRRRGPRRRERRSCGSGTRGARITRLAARRGRRSADRRGRAGLGGARAPHPGYRRSRHRPAETTPVGSAGGALDLRLGRGARRGDRLRLPAVTEERCGGSETATRRGVSHTRRPSPECARPVPRSPGRARDPASPRRARQDARGSRAPPPADRRRVGRTGGRRGTADREPLCTRPREAPAGRSRI